MVKRKLTVRNPAGLHARPAADFSALARRFCSDVTVRRADAEGCAVNAKSILWVLTQGVMSGTHIEIAACGPDEAAAVETLAAFIDSGCGETLL